MRQGDAIDLDASAGYLLKQASSALRTSMEAVLRPLGLGMTEYSCLELLAQRPGLSSSDLARGAFVSRQAMNVLLRSLEDEGLVSRAAVAPAGRTLPAELTAAGRLRLDDASRAVRGVEDRMLDGFAPGDRARFLGLLRSCVGNLMT